MKRTRSTWASMNYRCNNPKCLSYKHYGGRGISVCDRWKSFENFLHDMGFRPEGKTIDRIDVNGNYAPENCKWSTPTEQARNRRDNKILHHDGNSIDLPTLAESKGLSRSLLKRRLELGWDLDRALSEERHDEFVAGSDPMNVRAGDSFVHKCATRRVRRTITKIDAIFVHYKSNDEEIERHCLIPTFRRWWLESEPAAPQPDNKESR